jgi:hypothetical protein
LLYFKILSFLLVKIFQACEPQFKHIQDECFQKAKEKLEMVTTVTAETAIFRVKLENLNDQLDLLMQKLMSDERRWENIMMMQVSLCMIYVV